MGVLKGGTMSYRLKSGVPAFREVDGPMAGRTYRPGEHYVEIPRHLAGRFEPVNALDAEASPEAASADVTESTTGGEES
jgi:hypothetical protein